MKKIILVILFMLILTGCSGSNSSMSTTKDDQHIVPNILSLSNSDAGNYFYVVDKNTHVVYLAFDSYNRAAITVLLKADGSPMLAEDLGIKVD